MPSASAVWKAASRLGPWVPAVPARASSWQEPQFSTNIALPFERLGASPPQAPSGRTTATAHSAATTPLTVWRGGGTGGGKFLVLGGAPNTPPAPPFPT